MKRSGSADLPLHYGYVPRWLAERMAKLGLAITEAIIAEYGERRSVTEIIGPLLVSKLWRRIGHGLALIWCNNVSNGSNEKGH